MSKEEDALDAQFAASMKDHPLAKAVQASSTPTPSSDKISPATSAGRGAMSGLLMGFQPQAAGAVDAINPWSKNSYSQGRDEAAAKNESAYQANPYSYGAGYVGGMLAPAVVSGGASGAMNMARGAEKGAVAADALWGAKEGALDALKGITAVRQSQGAQPGLGTGVGSYIRENVPGVATRTIGGATNQQDSAPIIPQRAYTPGTQPWTPPKSSIGGVPLSQADPEDNKAMQTASSAGEPSVDTKSEVPPHMFGTLMDFLAQAQNSNNPAVQEQARQTAEATAQEPNNQDLNRLLAMRLQATQAGRAVGNEDSPVNEEDQTA